MNIKHFLLVPGFIMASNISDAKVLQSRTNACVYEHPQRKAKEVRDVAWIIPSRTKKINGLAFGLAAMPAKHSKQIISGLSIEANPLIIVLPYLGMYWDANRSYKERLSRTSTEKKLRIISDSTIEEITNGLSITTLSMAEGKNNGLSVNLIGSFVYEHGVALSALFNGNNHFKGVQMASLYNTNAYGKGISVAAVNVCNNCSGLQIGLINKNGKKTTPFFSYRSKKKALRIAKEQHIAEAFFQ